MRAFILLCFYFILNYVQGDENLKPRNVSQLDVTSTTLLIGWQPPISTSEYRESYRVRVHNESDILIVAYRVENISTSFRITCLEPNTTYIVKVSGLYKRNSSEQQFGINITVKTLPQESTTYLERIWEHREFVFIGVGFTFAVCVIVATVAVCACSLCCQVSCNRVQGRKVTLCSGMKRRKRRPQCDGNDTDLVIQSFKSISEDETRYSVDPVKVSFPHFPEDQLAPPVLYPFPSETRLPAELPLPTSLDSSAQRKRSDNGREVKPPSVPKQDWAAQDDVTDDDVYLNQDSFPQDDVEADYENTLFESKDHRDTSLYVNTRQLV